MASKARTGAEPEKEESLASCSPVSIETYLRSSYRPDCDYIDGEVRERYTGEVRHGRLQVFFVDLFARHEPEWQLVGLPVVRLQVTPTRVRVPDVLALPLAYLSGRIVDSVPSCCIEIFSSEEPMSRMQERVADYARMGVPAIWIVDPWRRVAYTGGRDGKLTPEEAAFAIPGTPISVKVDEVFASLDLPRPA